MGLAACCQTCFSSERFEGGRAQEAVMGGATRRRAAKAGAPTANAHAEAAAVPLPPAPRWRPLQRGATIFACVFAVGAGWGSHTGQLPPPVAAAVVLAATLIVRICAGGALS